MKTGRKTLIWTIILLAALNLGTIGTIILRSWQWNRAVDRESYIDVERRVTNRGQGPMIGIMTIMDETQTEQFSQYNHHFRNKGRAISMHLNRIRNQMMTEMTQANPDTVLLGVLSDSVGMLHSTLKKETYRYYLNLNRICRPDQKEALQQHFRQLFGSDRQEMTSMQGKGRRGGRNMMKQRQPNNLNN